MFFVSVLWHVTLGGRFGYFLFFFGSGLGKSKEASEQVAGKWRGGGVSEVEGDGGEEVPRGCLQGVLGAYFLLIWLRSPRPATGVSPALRARSVPGVSPRVSLKTGVSEGVSEGVSPGPFRPRVCKKCPTLPQTPPVFRDTLGDTPGTLRARRAGEAPVAGRGDRNNMGGGVVEIVFILQKVFCAGEIRMGDSLVCLWQKAPKHNCKRRSS